MDKNALAMALAVGFISGEECLYNLRHGMSEPPLGLTSANAKANANAEPLSSQYRANIGIGVYSQSLPLRMEPIANANAKAIKINKIMQIVLTTQCMHIAGSLGKGFGYSIQFQNGQFVSKRNSRGYVPNYGHYRFILACAELAMLQLHIKDISVSREELMEAAREASSELRDNPYTLIYYHIRQDTGREFYHARDIFFLHKLYEN